MAHTETHSTRRLANTLLTRLSRRDQVVGEIGPGFVGLPLLIELAQAGCRAIGPYIDQSKVAATRARRSYVPDVPTVALAELRSADGIDARTDVDVIIQPSGITICGPGPLPNTVDSDSSYRTRVDVGADVPGGGAA